MTSAVKTLAVGDISLSQARLIYRRLTGGRAGSLRSLLERFPHLKGSREMTVNQRRFTYFITARLALYGPADVFGDMFGWRWEGAEE